MTGMLQHRDDGGPVAACVGCGIQAVGPCARCHAPLCGDCCIITEGGTKKWAICPTCAEGGAQSLTAGWVNVLMWICVPMVGLALLLWLLHAVAG